MRLLLLRKQCILFMSILVAAAEAAEEGSQVLGEFCDEDDDCYDDFNLECDEEHQYCICRKGYTALDFMCKKEAMLGEDCTYNQQCWSQDKNTVCSGGHCVCKVDYVAVLLPRQKRLNNSLYKCVPKRSKLQSLYGLMVHDDLDPPAILPLFGLAIIFGGLIVAGCLLKCCTMLCQKKKSSEKLLRTPGSLQQKRYYQYDTFPKPNESERKPHLVPKIIITPDSLSVREEKNTVYV